MPERIDSLRARLREDALRRGINPRDVDLLLGTILDRSLPWLIAHGDEQVDPEPLEVLLARRYRGEPLQYIRGKADFYSREFLVDDRVLIPRPETELVVEDAVSRAGQHAVVIDIGTGSGCIAISIERERPDLNVVAVLFRAPQFGLDAYPAVKAWHARCLARPAAQRAIAMREAKAPA